MNNIPEIRFPEFKKDGDWEKKKLGELSEITNGKANVQDHIDGGQYPLFDRSAVIKASNKYIFDCEVVIIPGEGMRFIPKYYNGKFNLHQRAYAIKDFKCSGLFIYYSLDYKQKIISQKAVQSTVLSLRLPILQNFEIEVPRNPKEQLKIVDCLSSLDEVISGQEEKLRALQNHKKGLIQNLFPQEGKTVPNYRFPEFADDGDWEEKNFDNIATFLKGKGISKADIVEDGETPCIRYGELYTTYNETIDEVVSYTDLPVKELLFSKANDVIIPASGETQLDIATASCVLNDDIALGGDLNIIRSTNNGVFLSYYLNNAKKYEIARMAQGNAVVHLYAHQLKTLNLQLPKIKEQQKIAHCLSSVDGLILDLLNKIERLKLHKKGLMQGLFPKIKERR